MRQFRPQSTVRRDRDVDACMENQARRGEERSRSLFLSPVFPKMKGDGEEEKIFCTKSRMHSYIHHIFTSNWIFESRGISTFEVGHGLFTVIIGTHNKTAKPRLIIVSILSVTAISSGWVGAS